MEKQYFGTDGIRGKVGKPPISADWMLKLGWAIGTVLSQSKHGKVVIGKDTRISGYMIESALEAGLAASATDIYLLGPMPTPGVAYLTNKLQADAGIVISASHNCYEDNGVKFFSKGGTKLADDIELSIEQALAKPMVTAASSQLGKAKRLTSGEEQYVDFCKESFAPDLSLAGLTIVVDCANGANYRIAPRVFTELGAKVHAIAASPDGLNINVECGSTAPAKLITAVKRHRADLGIAFDGDGDRVIFVDHLGNVVDGDELLFIIASWQKTTGRKINGVVGTVMSNLGLEHAIKAINLPFARTKVGDRHVLTKLQQNNWQLGGENSGHIICRDLHTTGDGIIAALQVLAAVVQSGSSIAELKKPVIKNPQVLLNVAVQNSSKLFDNAAIKHAYQKVQDKLKETGRVLIRASGTEAVVRVMVEGEDHSLINMLAKELGSVISMELQSA